MLNIGKMDADAGVGRYYLDAVARGREDYYTHSGEAPGRWWGGGCGAHGLEGRVEDAPFLALLQGVDPNTGEMLGEPFKGRKDAKAVAGLDLTFRAPKSVSLLYALGSTYGHQDVTDLTRDAHDRAVEEALTYMAVVAGHARRGKGGLVRIESTGLVHGLFRHRTSRAGDPQLHTHAVTPNRIQGVDGKWGSLDSKAFYSHAKTAGTIYQSALRYHLRELGLEWDLGRDQSGKSNGTAEIRGVDRKVLKEFSRRSQEIEKALAERGLDRGDGRAAQKATLSTRQKKDYGVDEALLEFDWSQRAGRRGFTVQTMDDLLRDGRERWDEVKDTVEDRERTAADDAGNLLLSGKGLTERASTFIERDVIRQMAAELPDGAPVERVLSYASELLGDEEIVNLPLDRGSLPRSEVIRPWNGTQRGRIIPALGISEMRYSTRELQTRERQLVEWAVDGKSMGHGLCHPQHVQDALDMVPVKLNAEQETMVRAICLSGDFITTVNAAAGCGKTTSVGAAARALEASGHRVIGVSLAAKAAGILQDETGVPCFTVAQLEWELSKEQWEGFSPGTVVIVDEASMVGTRSFHHITRELRDAGGKLVPIGDVHQMPEVDAGGAFRGLMADGRLRSVELVRNMRQLDPIEQQRLRDLRMGSVADAIRSYDDAGRITKADTSEDSRNLLAIDWSVDWIATAAGAPDPAEAARIQSSVIMLGFTNPDVADLNRRARVLLKDAGVLTGPELIVGDDDRGFMVGDHVVTREISRRSSFHVLNGERWIVAALDQEARSATLHFVPSKAGDQHRDVTVPDWYLESGSLHHAYAVTVNIAQGSTVQSVYVMGSEAAYRQAVYTAASRPRDDGLHFYICRDPEWVDDAMCELPHAPATVDRRQMTFDLGELGVLVPSEVSPLDEFTRLSSRIRGDSMSIDTRSPAEPVYATYQGSMPPARQPDREQAGETLDLGLDDL